MPSLLTTIVEGPREEDGRVRYKCDACGNVTNWILPGRAEHYCRPGDNALLRKQGFDVPATSAEGPCCESFLKSAANMLSSAMQKAETDDLKEGIQAHIEGIRPLMRLAVLEATMRKDQADAAASGADKPQPTPTA